MSTNLLTHGNFYARKLYTGAGRVGELIPLNPKLVKPKWNKAGSEVLYEFREPSGVTKDLLAEDILHIRGLSLDGLTGLSPIAAAKESIGLSMANEQHAAALFGNGAKPGGVIYFKNPISEPAQKKFEDDWIAKFRGGGHGKVALLQADEVKYETLGLSNDDAQFIENRQFQLSEIARIFRVPAHMIGDLSKSSFSNIEQQSLEFVVHTLRPWLVNIEQAIHKSLLSDKERKTHYVQFSVDGLLRGDIKTRYEAYNIAIQTGLRNRDEIRDLEDLNPIPNGEGKIFLQPLNMVKVGEEKKPDQKDARSLDKAREGLLKLLDEQIKRAMRKDCEAIRKAINAGTLDDFIPTFKDKRADFLAKLIRNVGTAYAGLYSEGLKDDKLDEITEEFSCSIYDEFSELLKSEPNAGLIAQKFESDSEIRNIGHSYFKKIFEEATC
jgi:HK97 family phage portal protein